MVVTEKRAVDRYTIKQGLSLVVFFVSLLLQEMDSRLRGNDDFFKEASSNS